MGRPRKFDSRSEECKTRMSREELFQLNNLCKKEDFSKSECLRKGVKALIFLSEKGLINWATETDGEENLDYCGTEINEDID